MPIQFSDMVDFFSNSFLSSFPPFYTTNIIQLSRCPYLQLIPHSIVLLFLHFIENSLNWQKLPLIIEFARALEWLLNLNPKIQSRYKIKNLAKILAPDYVFFCKFWYLLTKIRAKFMKVWCFSRNNGNESPGDYIWGLVLLSGSFSIWITNS